jgi:hypothetical protein
MVDYRRGLCCSRSSFPICLKIYRIHRDSRDILAIDSDKQVDSHYIPVELSQGLSLEN